MPAAPLNIKRECTHGGRHKHGTPAMYSADRCRCRPCSRSRIADNARRRRLTVYGQWQPFIPADPIREHVRALLDQGMTLHAIRDRAGVSTGCLQRLMYDSPERSKSGKVRTENGEALLGVTARPRQPQWVDATGTRRRLQALVACGWSMAKLAVELGVEMPQVHRWVRADQCNRATVAKVTALYERLWNQPPPTATKFDKIAVARSLTLARRNGWPPPLYWDDDTIDRPDASPCTPPQDRRTTIDPVAVQELTVGRRVQANRREIRAAVQVLTERGYPAAEIAHRIRQEPRSVQRIRHTNRTKQQEVAS